jgi:integral membrane protein
MIKTLRLLALLEGISTITLFGIAMPLKYIFHYDAVMFPIGMTHGVLFLAYCFCVVLVAFMFKWKFKTTGLALLASLFPGGTFIADYYIFRRSNVASKPN